MGESRTKNVSRNAIFAIVCQIVNLLLNFFIRTVFIRELGAEYLGVNGLFTNVLTILSFAELGIGNAIVFSMYKPLATSDTEEIKSLMRLYKTAYNYIGILVAVVGLGVTPFIKYIVKEKPDIPENIAVLYVLFLANTVVSYFFTYKKNIIIADQKNHVIIGVSQIVTLVKTIFQITFLMIAHQFLIYLLLQILFTVIENLVCSVIADKMYPYLKEEAMPLEKAKTNKIFTDVKALALYKFGSVILNGTDNILISAMIGVREVGLVSNYLLLTTSCNSLLNKITEVFTSSVGNLNATEGEEKQYNVFNKLFFLTSWIFGFASVGLLVVSQNFIMTWVGEDYLLSYAVLVAIVSEFYIKGVHSVAYTYRSTLGYFVEGKWSAILAAVINLILSIVLCWKLGIFGIFIATPISRVLSVGIVDPVLIFHRGFKKSVTKYYVRYILYTALYILIAIVCKLIVAQIPITGWQGVVLQILVVTIIFNSIVVLFFWRTKMFKEIINMFCNMFKNRRKEQNGN